MYTHIEDYIYELYSSIGVNGPDDLDMSLIARKLNVEIVYKQSAFRFENEIILVRGNKCEEWIDFGHEMCHFLRHCGSQLTMHPLFRKLQEWQADYFAYHFCVPTFMLKNIKGVSVYDIMNLFNVDFDFACKRLEMYKSKLIFWGLNNGRRNRVGKDDINLF